MFCKLFLFAFLIFLGISSAFAAMLIECYERNIVCYFFATITYLICLAIALSLVLFLEEKLEQSENFEKS